MGHASWGLGRGCGPDLQGVVGNTCMLLLGVGVGSPGGRRPSLGPNPSLGPSRGCPAFLILFGPKKQAASSGL